MGESLIQVTEGTGKKLHTNSRVIGANTVEDEYVIAGLPPIATYTFEGAGISLATGSSHVLQIMAGASLAVYLLRVQVFQDAAATTAAFCQWSFRRLTTAGTGGTAKTGAAHDQADAAAGAAGMTLPTVKGTEGSVPFRCASYLTQTPGAAGINMPPLVDWQPGALGIMKPIRIPAGATSGIAIRNDTAHAGATVTIVATIAELSY